MIAARRQLIIAAASPSSSTAGIRESDDGGEGEICMGENEANIYCYYYCYYSYFDLLLMRGIIITTSVSTTVSIVVRDNNF